MGFMNELKKLARPYAEDEEDFDEEYEDETEEEAAPEAEEKPARTARAPKAERPAPKQTASRPAASAGNVVNFRSGSNLQVILVKPETFESVSDVADHLRNKCAVVLNLEYTDKDTARRLVDFLTGCAYALDGNIQRVATSTYIITPFNVDVVGNLKEELKNSGIY